MGTNNNRYSHYATKTARIAFPILFFFIFAFLLYVAIRTLFFDRETSIFALSGIDELANYFVLYSCLGIFLLASPVVLVACVLQIMDNHLRVSIIKDGIRIKLPLFREKLVEWDEFVTICICYDYFSVNEFSLEPIICFVKYGEKTREDGRWRTSNPFHNHRLIRIRFTEELYENLLMICPVKIYDLRDTESYRIDATKAWK